MSKLYKTVWISFDQGLNISNDRIDLMETLFHIDKESFNELFLSAFTQVILLSPFICDDKLAYVKRLFKRLSEVVDLIVVDLPLVWFEDFPGVYLVASGDDVLTSHYLQSNKKLIFNKVKGHMVDCNNNMVVTSVSGDKEGIDLSIQEQILKIIP
jgi:hypothetical protein